LRILACTRKPGTRKRKRRLVPSPLLVPAIKADRISFPPCPRPGWRERYISVVEAGQSANRESPPTDRRGEKIRRWASGDGLVIDLALPDREPADRLCGVTLSKRVSGILSLLPVPYSGQGLSLNVLPRAPGDHVADGRLRNSVFPRQPCEGLTLGSGGPDFPNFFVVQLCIGVLLSLAIRQGGLHHVFGSGKSLEVADA
jgi:hypothetical protein